MSDLSAGRKFTVLPMPKWSQCAASASRSKLRQPQSYIRSNVMLSKYMPKRMTSPASQSTGSIACDCDRLELVQVRANPPPAMASAPPCPHLQRLSRCRQWGRSALQQAPPLDVHGGFCRQVPEQRDIQRWSSCCTAKQPSLAVQIHFQLAPLQVSFFPSAPPSSPSRGA